MFRMPSDPNLRSSGDDVTMRAPRRRWARKNTPEHIRARQDALRAQPQWDPRHDFIFESPIPAEVLGAVVETLTAHLVLPVSVVGPLRLTLGSYHVDETDGHLVDDGRHTEEVYVPLAHSEGGLSASMQRGMAAVLDGGTLETWVLRDRMTRDSCFVFETTAQAMACAAWLSDHTGVLREWLHDPSNPGYAQSLG